jgi:hypothetical protein
VLASQENPSCVEKYFLKVYVLFKGSRSAHPKLFYKTRYAEIQGQMDFKLHWLQASHMIKASVTAAWLRDMIQGILYIINA